MIVVSWMIVVVMTDMEVEVEEARAEFSVPVPVAGGVQTETADADGDCHTQNRARETGNANHGFAEASHLVSRLILADPAAQSASPTHPRRFLGSASGLARNDI